MRGDWINGSPPVDFFFKKKNIDVFYLFFYIYFFDYYLFCFYFFINFFLQSCPLLFG
jgi:hypothetical protein